MVEKGGFVGGQELSRVIITIHVDKIYDHLSLNPLSQTTHNLILSKNKMKIKTKFKLGKKCT